LIRSNLKCNKLLDSIRSDRGCSHRPRPWRIWRLNQSNNSRAGSERSNLKGRLTGAGSEHQTAIPSFFSTYYGTIIALYLFLNRPLGKKHYIKKTLCGCLIRLFNQKFIIDYLINRNMVIYK
jgi:hypothetical protein